MNTQIMAYAYVKKRYMCIQCSSNRTPDFTKVLFSVLGEKRSEGRFFGERTSLVVRRLEWVDFPLPTRS